MASYEYAVDMSDGDTLFFGCHGINSKAEAAEAANEDAQKQAKGARAVKVTRHEVKGEATAPSAEDIMGDFNYRGSHWHY